MKSSPLNTSCPCTRPSQHLPHAPVRDAKAAVSLAHAALHGLYCANWPFCACGAVAAVLIVKYLAWKDGKLDHAHDHVLHSSASLVLAICHLLA